MEKKILFPQIGGIMHGGDYNPEQWLDRPDILEEDIRMMKKAGMNCATLGVFSWSTYEPREGEFHFAWLHDIMDKLYANGIYTILATPSGARPAWLDETYPECRRVDSYGVREHHGVRHNHCMSAPVYRKKVSVIVNKLADEFGNHPGLLMWHISNEFGGECYCPHCVKRFQDYLAEKFDHDIEKLNKAWWTTFWSHNYNDFSQIEPPYRNGEFSIMGLNLEWKRFTTWNMTDYMKAEIAILKERTPQIPVTTNFMKEYDGLDYHKMQQPLDVVSWDSYPRFHNDEESFSDTMTENAFDHAMIRCLKKEQPFMLMESAPGLVNWHPFNKMKRPGVHRLASLQAVALGSDTVQYFQWRKGRGSFEQYHGAVVDHLGTDDTRVFREVADLGEELKKLKDLAGTVVKAPVAVLYDWDSLWATDGMKGLAESTRNYIKTCRKAYCNLSALGVDVDVISSEEDYTGYSVIVAPMLYLLHPHVGERMKQFVEHGGHLIATYVTGYVDENQLNYLGGFPGDGLKDLFGVISEEIDTLYPSDRNRVHFAEMPEGEVRDYAEVLRVADGTNVLGTYEQDYYKGMAAVTERTCQKGSAMYIAARLDDASMQRLYARTLKKAGVSMYKLPYGVERHTREADGMQYVFYLNDTTEPQIVSGAQGIDLLTGETIKGILTLEPYGVACVKE
ncbi:MAG: beta-galactosidase [Lachnospiraceae bacterium]|nr:beta-galactosidase [Lachnospiraceae bacterium]